MPIGRRQELLAWAGEVKGRYIIEDDYDSEFRFTGRPLPTLQSIDAGGRVIYTNTFSKSLAPSIRISYMVLPGALMERFRRELSFYACTVTSFEQYTLARFLSEGHFERHINRMKKYYRTERDAVIGAIGRSRLPDARKFWSRMRGYTSCCACARKRATLRFPKKLPRRVSGFLFFQNT